MADDLASLRKQIDQLPKAVTAAMRAVAERTAKDVMARARQLVPVDSGYTRENIHVEEDAANTQFQVIPGTDRPRVRFAPRTNRRTGRQHTQKVTLNMLPNWIEYGTSKMRARPFMRPAADAVDAKYKKDMQQAAERAAAEALK